MIMVKDIKLYGNGRVLGTRAHHVLVVLHLDNDQYELLEVKKTWLKIKIHRLRADSLEGALQGRVKRNEKVDEWGSHKGGCKPTPMAQIEEVIKKYHGTSYDVLEKNCRHFADDLLEICGSMKRCDD